MICTTTIQRLKTGSSELRQQGREMMHFNGIPFKNHCVAFFCEGTSSSSSSLIVSLSCEYALGNNVQLKLTELLAGQMEVGTKKKAVATHYCLIKIQ